MTQRATVDVLPTSTAYQDVANTWTMTATFQATVSVRPGVTFATLNIGRSDTHGVAALVGIVNYLGKNATGAELAYSSLAGYANDDTAGNEDGRLDFNTYVAGVNARRAYVQNGLIIGEAMGADKGQGTVNVSSGYYIGGTNLFEKVNTWSGTQKWSVSPFLQTTALAPFNIRRTDEHGSPITLARFEYVGRNSTPADYIYARLDNVILDHNAGSEANRFDWWTSAAGTLATRMTVAQGFYMAGATGSDKGPGTINCTSLYLNGTDILAKSNTWTASQTVQSIFSVRPSGVQGDLRVGRTDTHGSATLVGILYFSGKDSAGADADYASLNVYAADDTDTSEDGRLEFHTSVAGSSGRRGYFLNGLTMGNPTGGDKGAGTINAVSVYDDNALLTCYPFDQYLDGEISLAKWDAKVPDMQIPEGPTHEKQVTKPVVDIVEEMEVVEGQKRFVRKEITREIPITEDVPVFDEVGQPLTDDDGVAVTREVPVMVTVAGSSATTETRHHEPLRKFVARNGTPHDPLTLEGYAAHWREKRHLTSMPNEATFTHGDMSTGEWVQRLVETVEIQAILIEELHQRVKTLEIN